MQKHHIGMTSQLSSPEKIEKTIYESNIYYWLILKTHLINIYNWFIKNTRQIFVYEKYKKNMGQFFWQ